MGMLRQGLAVVLCSTQVGCYEWVEVRPSELPKLDARYEADRTGTPAPREARLEKSDGSVLEIGRNADARITVDGEVSEFTAPVVARVVGENLVIQAGNARRRAFKLEKVEGAELAKFDGSMTAQAIVGGVAAGTLVIVVLVLAANDASKPLD